MKVLKELFDAIFTLFLFLVGSVGLLLGSVYGHHYADSTMILFSTMFLAAVLGGVQNSIDRK